MAEDGGEVGGFESRNLLVVCRMGAPAVGGLIFPFWDAVGQSHSLNIRNKG